MLGVTHLSWRRLYMMYNMQITQITKQNMIYITTSYIGKQNNRQTS